MRTGSTTGIIKNCKVGDCTIELGADSQFAGECVVVEAKEDASYDLKKALTEIDTGRRNRGADVGVFVFSKRTAPSHLGSLARHGRDIIVVWDADDPATDVYFDAALTLSDFDLNSCRPRGTAQQPWTQHRSSMSPGSCSMRLGSDRASVCR